MSEQTVPAFTEANRRRVDPSACACRVNDGEIVRCPLHAAAPKLLGALEAIQKELFEYSVANNFGKSRIVSRCIELTRDGIEEAKGEA
jgi:hypothetical protein